jgi:hypothetical protein
VVTWLLALLASLLWATTGVGAGYGLATILDPKYIVAAVIVMMVASTTVRNIQTLSSQIDMTFAELQLYIQGLASDRVPQALTEMVACEQFARFLNTTRGTHYEGVSKDFTLEDDGVDAKIYEPGTYDTNIYVQVTRAREYNMSPQYPHASVELDGTPIVDALEYKCSVYQDRGVFTQAIVLLIVGVTPAAIVQEHLDHEHFRKPFEDTTCFNGIYYVTGEEVVELKRLELPEQKSAILEVDETTTHTTCLGSGDCNTHQCSTR